jgi:GNAT superfamily N-acetyltransferase
VRRVRETMLELAEESGLWVPLAATSDLVVGDGYVVVTGIHDATVERIRLADETVERALEEVRALGRERGLRHATWWVGERSTPAGLAARLEALGLEPDPELPEMTSLTIDHAPAGEPRAEVHRVETLDEYLAALELDWDVWDVPEEDRAAQRDSQREAWPSIVAGGNVSVHVAYVDGEPVGFGRTYFAPQAAMLLGGSVLPRARGRGAYAALVHARWREAVERGVPRMSVSAGPMSAPILEHLGFEPIGRIHLLRDRL